MVEKTLESYFKVCILLIILLFVPHTIFAQEQKTTTRREQKQEQEEEKAKKALKEYKYSEIPFLKGISIGYDLMGPIYKVYSDDYISHEIAVDFNLKNRFFPVVELGYGIADKWGDKGIHYKTKAPYARIGLDYNFFYKKRHNNILSLGIRYAFTSFDYEVHTMPIIDDITGEIIEYPSIWDDITQEYYKGKLGTNFSGRMHWLEFVANVRTRVFYNFHMSWSFRLRSKLSSKSDEGAQPWYVPGFGIYKSMRFGINYSIIYTIPFGKKK